MYRPETSKRRRRAETPEGAGGLLGLIRDSAIETYFQPIIDLGELKVIGLEALTRPADTEIFPDASAMFSAAATLGLLPSLETVARRRIMSRAKPWPTSALLFLNLSPDALAEAGVAERIDSEVRPTHQPSRVVIEITESHADTATIRDAAKTLRRRGFQIALDDLGAGSQDLRRVVEIRPDWIKLDRELIRDIDRDPIRQQLVNSLASFARRVACNVVAEGVERVDELLALRRLGVSHAQGYLIAHPSTCHQCATTTASRELPRLLAA